MRAKACEDKFLVTPCGILVGDMVTDDRKRDDNILHVLVLDADAVAVRPVRLVLIDVSDFPAADLYVVVNAHQVAHDTQFSAVYRSADFGVHDAEFLFQLGDRLAVFDKDIFVHYLRYLPLQLQHFSSVLLNGEAVAGDIAFNMEHHVFSLSNTSNLGLRENSFCSI